MKAASVSAKTYLPPTRDRSSAPAWILAALALSGLALVPVALAYGIYVAVTALVEIAGSVIEATLLMAASAVPLWRLSVAVDGSVRAAEFLYAVSVDLGRTHGDALAVAWAILGDPILPHVFDRLV